MRGWLDPLERELEVARRAGEIDREIRPADAVLELNALAQPANCAFRLRGDPTAFARARRWRSLLAVPLHGVCIARLRPVGVGAGVAEGPALAQQIPTSVELDLDRTQAHPVFFERIFIRPVPLLVAP
jgi:hypothetical protein